MADRLVDKRSTGVADRFAVICWPWSFSPAKLALDARTPIEALSASLGLTETPAASARYGADTRTPALRVLRLPRLQPLLTVATSGVRLSLPREAW